MKPYLVTYLSPYDLHEHFRCYAKNKREARMECKACLGDYCCKIVEVEELN